MKTAHAIHQFGGSLLEVLIAVLIMSFGLLALGSLTAASLQYGKSAQFQTIGVQMVGDLTDRMRGNVDAFAASTYNQTAVYTGSNAALTAPGDNCTSAICTSTQLAAWDLFEWRTDLRRRLPAGDAYVLRDAVNPLAVDVWIMWREATLADGLSVAASTDCPAAAVTGVSPLPRCTYFRVSI